MDRQRYWDTVYRTCAPDAVGWYRPHLETSLSLITAASQPSDPVIDVGGGASTLVDDLLALAYTEITVADLSSSALELAKLRLAEKQQRVRWLAADILAAALPPEHYGVWHDRAVFHFLTDAADRDRYVAQVRKALRRDGQLVIASFGPQGPQSCSGLPVVRFDVPDLCRDFSGGFELVEHLFEDHRTPGGNVQQFVCCRFRRAG